MLQEAIRWHSVLGGWSRFDWVFVRETFAAFLHAAKPHFGARELVCELFFDWPAKVADLKRVCVRARMSSVDAFSYIDDDGGAARSKEASAGGFRNERMVVASRASKECSCALGDSRKVRVVKELFTTMSSTA